MASLVTPFPYEIAYRIEDLDRVVAPIKQMYHALRIGSYSRHLPEFMPIRQLTPSVDHVVDEISISDCAHPGPLDTQIT